MPVIKDNSPSPKDLNLFIGARLREARRLRDISQQRLGAALRQPVTFQQMQKYEQGVNRVSAARLYEFSCILDMPVSFFLPNDGEDVPPLFGVQELQMIRGFCRLTPPSRQALVTLVDTLTR